MQGQPGFVGGFSGHPFIVKNHFELKNAQRVLVRRQPARKLLGRFYADRFLDLPHADKPGKPVSYLPSARMSVRFTRSSTLAACSDRQVPSNGADPVPQEGVTAFTDILDRPEFEERTIKALDIFAMVIAMAPRLHDVHIEHVTTSSVPRYIISFLAPNPEKMSELYIGQ